jgi:hypothetical protein
MNYAGFQIESFEAGKNLWHARISRLDRQPVTIDGEVFPTLELGFAWSDPDNAIADAKRHIDRLTRRDLTAPAPQAEPRQAA